jgi:uncharacterized protein YjgD (DUF1641 family)
MLRVKHSVAYEWAAVQQQVDTMNAARRDVVAFDECSSRMMAVAMERKLAAEEMTRVANDVMALAQANSKLADELMAKANAIVALAHHKLANEVKPSDGK